MTEYDIKLLNDLIENLLQQEDISDLPVYAKIRIAMELATTYCKRYSWFTAHEALPIVCNAIIDHI